MTFLNNVSRAMKQFAMFSLCLAALVFLCFPLSLARAEAPSVAAQADIGTTKVGASATLDGQKATLSAENPDTKAKIAVDAKKQTVVSKVQTANGSGEAQINAAKGTGQFEVKSGNAEISGKADVPKGKASATVSGASGSATVSANAKKQTVSTQVQTANGSGEAQANFAKGTGQFDVKSGSTEVSGKGNVTKGTYQANVDTDAYSAQAKVNAQKGTAQVKYESGDLSSQTDINAKNQTVKTKFEDGAVSGNAQADLKKGTAKAHIETSQTQEFTGKSDLGTVNAKLTAGAEADASLKISKDKVAAKVSGQIGLAAELEAVSERAGFGDQNVNASVQVGAKVEALIGAKASVGLQIDKTGITIGMDAKAGAYISAEVKVNFEFNFFGIKTNVTAMAEGHAGVLAQVKAVVKIGFNGKVKFQLSGGISVGVGGSLGAEFEVDATELMARLNIPDLSALIEWLEKFQKNPEAAFRELAADAAKRLIDAGAKFLADKLAEPVLNLVNNVILPSIENMPNLVSNAWSGVSSWFHGTPPTPPTPPNQPPGGSNGGITGGTPPADPNLLQNPLDSPKGGIAGGTADAKPPVAGKVPDASLKDNSATGRKVTEDSASSGRKVTEDSAASGRQAISGK